MSLERTIKQKVMGTTVKIQYLNACDWVFKAKLMLFSLNALERFGIRTVLIAIAIKDKGK